MYIVIGCWFYIIRPSVQSLFFALSPYFSLCLCHFELSLYWKASNNNNNNNNSINTEPAVLIEINSNCVRGARRSHKVDLRRVFLEKRKNSLMVPWEL